MTVLTQGSGKKMTPGWVRSNVVARRADPRGAGGFTCHCCGGHTHSIADMAQVIGVSSSTLSRWLKREAVRQDVAERIRAAFLRVEEQEERRND